MKDQKIILKFKDESKNKLMVLSGNPTKENIVNYFIDGFHDVGDVGKPEFHQCIGIEFLNSDKKETP